VNYPLSYPGKRCPLNLCITNRFSPESSHLRNKVRILPCVVWSYALKKLMVIPLSWCQEFHQTTFQLPRAHKSYSHTWLSPEAGAACSSPLETHVIPGVSWTSQSRACRLDAKASFYIFIWTGILMETFFQSSFISKGTEILVLCVTSGNLFSILIHFQRYWDLSSMCDLWKPFFNPEN
jgi:hypothetical protein